MVSEGPNFLQVFVPAKRDHAPIHHHGGAGFAPHALLQTLQPLLERLAVLAVALEDFMRFGKTVPAQHQSYQHLLAVESLVPRVAQMGL
jgi:hypothetical protein